MMRSKPAHLEERLAKLEEAVGTMTAWKLTCTEMESKMNNFDKNFLSLANHVKVVQNMVVDLQNKVQQDLATANKAITELHQIGKEAASAHETTAKLLKGQQEQIKHLQDQLEKMKAKTPKKEA